MKRERVHETIKNSHSMDKGTAAYTPPFILFYFNTFCVEGACYDIRTSETSPGHFKRRFMRDQETKAPVKI
jgi:hypothetical protein